MKEMLHCTPSHPVAARTSGSGGQTLPRTTAQRPTTVPSKRMAPFDDDDNTIDLLDDNDSAYETVAPQLPNAVKSHDSDEIYASRAIRAHDERVARTGQSTSNVEDPPQNRPPTRRGRPDVEMVAPLVNGTGLKRVERMKGPDGEITPKEIGVKKPRYRGSISQRHTGTTAVPPKPPTIPAGTVPTLRLDGVIGLMESGLSRWLAGSASMRVVENNLQIAGDGGPMGRCPLDDIKDIEYHVSGDGGLSPVIVNSINGENTFLGFALDGERLHNFQFSMRERCGKPTRVMSEERVAEVIGVRSECDPAMKAARQESEIQASNAAAAARRRGFVFPIDGKNSVAINPDDFLRLNDGEFLNDTVIEFYIKFLMNELIPRSHPQRVQETHFFNSFFYEQLARKESGKYDADAAYQRVQKWTKRIDIFSMKYIFIPINEHYHWYLALIYNPGALLKEEEDEENELTDEPAAANVSDPSTPEETSGETTARASPELEFSGYNGVLNSHRVAERDELNMFDDPNPFQSRAVEEGKGREGVGKDEEHPIVLNEDSSLDDPMDVDEVGEDVDVDVVSEDVWGFEDHPGGVAQRKAAKGGASVLEAPEAKLRHVERVPSVVIVDDNGEDATKAAVKAALTTPSPRRSSRQAAKQGQGLVIEVSDPTPPAPQPRARKFAKKPMTAEDLKKEEEEIAEALKRWSTFAIWRCGPDISVD
ncbi:hypothetical protein HDV00_011073 [Rhizophlyctis rosea]|nr:hypothetical protein HDV00_011073 [Rhizophlyctis rosea]